LPDVIPSQPSPFDAQEIQFLESWVLKIWCEDSWWVIASPLLQRAKTSHWPFSPYSRQGACQTVPAVHDLLASP
jgi:hypothetical protein